MERARGKWTPAIALTASTMDEDRANALSAGFQIHLCKPMNLDELVSVVADLAGRQWLAAAA